jgi:hypothetical protein
MATVETAMTVAATMLRTVPVRVKRANLNIPGTGWTCQPDALGQESEEARAKEAGFFLRHVFLRERRYADLGNLLPLLLKSSQRLNPVYRPFLWTDQSLIVYQVSAFMASPPRKFSSTETQTL